MPEREQLTLNVFPSARPTGAGVLVTQSGSWESNRPRPSELLATFHGLLENGITAITVRHTNAPDATIPEAVEDVRRATRFVRSRAAGYNLDGDPAIGTGNSRPTSPRGVPGQVAEMSLTSNTRSAFPGTLPEPLAPYPSAAGM